MTKREDGKFKRNERDYYPTPLSAVLPLLPHLYTGTIFEEPCAGDGRLVDHLESNGFSCSYSCDIEPQRADIAKFNALDIKTTEADCFITNFPWEWKILQPLLDHLPNIAPTWSLLSADIMHNKRMIPYMKRCAKIASVGRVSWMDNGTSGFDNCAWFLFDRFERDTIFVERV